MALYDLRMTDGSTSRVVQKYRPKGLGPGSQVSVSGLDVSKDKRELLVSYENDQVIGYGRVRFSSRVIALTADTFAAARVDFYVPSISIYFGFSSISRRIERVLQFVQQR